MALPPKPWPTGLAEQCEPLVRRVLAPNPSPYTYNGTQTYIVGDGDEVAVIDPGPVEAVFEGVDPAIAHALSGVGHVDAILAAVGEARIVAIMCTHTHRDHSPAARPLKEATGAPIIGCAPLVIPVNEEGRSDASFDPTYHPDRVLVHGERVSGKGWTIEAIHTPGHTANHLCFSLLESGALFTGDHVMGWSTSVIAPPDGDMGAYMASLSALQERTDTVYYPAHGPAVTNPQQLVRGMLGHRRQREAQILRELGKGTNTIEAILPVMYKGLDPRLTGAAGKTVLAHLLALEDEGRVVREDERWTLAA